MDHTVLYSADAIRQEVENLAVAIDDTQVDSYLVVTVLKGAAIFSSDLVRQMRTEVELAYVTASSYQRDFTPGESLTIGQREAIEVSGRHVLIVEDIIDTGRTLEAMQKKIKAGDPMSVSTVALINKTGRRSATARPTHTGFDITDEFIYGYGLDWNQRFRNLPYIAVVKPETRRPTR